LRIGHWMERKEAAAEKMWRWLTSFFSSFYELGHQTLIRPCLTPDTIAARFLDWNRERLLDPKLSKAQDIGDQTKKGRVNLFNLKFLEVCNAGNAWEYEDLFSRFTALRWRTGKRLSPTSVS